MSGARSDKLMKYPTGYGGEISRHDLAYALRLTTGEVSQLMRTRETARQLAYDIDAGVVVVSGRRVVYPGLLSIEEYDAPIDMKGLCAYTGLKEDDVRRMLKTNSPVNVALAFAPMDEWTEDTCDEEWVEDTSDEDGEQSEDKESE